MAALAGPPPITNTNPFVRFAEDLRAERAATVPFPPGDTKLSARRTHRMARDPLPVLLDAYERHGPVFTLRIFHGNVVFMLGPEANHYMTVSHAQNFSWREGHMADLMPLLGDGLLTIDGDFHRRSRRIMLPAFHRERLQQAVDVMQEEIEAAVSVLQPDTTLDLYHWTRELALRVAMRALFGLDPDSSVRGLDAAHEFEVALGYWGRDYFMQVMRGPRSPWNQMRAARAKLDGVIFGEIERRRRTGERGDDILSLLLDAEDEDGGRLSDTHIRDEVMTLLFAGHDTTTSTVTFLLYELARAPEERAAVLAERDEVLGERAMPTAAEAMSPETLPKLEMAIDETLRLWPPAWIGPRRSLEPFEIGGVSVPGGVPVEYCSYASHRLPDVWDQPNTFRPQRFSPENRASIPKGAYVPFGGGSRTCIGMRFGQLEIRMIATRILRDFTVELDPAWRLVVRQTPTLGPRGGMPVRLHAR